MRVCRKCGAEINSANCCENGALIKKEGTKKAPKQRRSRQAPIQTEIVAEVTE